MRRLVGCIVPQNPSGVIIHPILNRLNLLLVNSYYMTIHLAQVVEQYNGPHFLDTPLR
jgi:hypothetical protein